MSKGFTANEAKKAYQAIDYSVMKQSTVLSYMDIFLYLEFYFCAVFQLYS
jgi:DHA2 family multidrug resistance protein